MLFKNFSSVAADVDPTQGIIKGYFAHFGSKDSDGDIITPDAFTRTIAEHGPKGSNRIKHLVNHDTGRPAGAIKELEADTVGLVYLSQLLKTKGGKFLPDAEMILAGVDSGYNFEHSIGYSEIAGKTERKPDANYLNELKLYEGSTLTFYGANANTPVTGLKSEGTLTGLLSLFHELEKALHRDNWSDEGFELIQKHYEAIGIALKSVETAEYKALTPAEKKDKAFLDQMIPHHEMALVMAKKVLNSDRLGAFAAGLIKRQSAEIEQMKKWEMDWFDQSATAPMKSNQPIGIAIQSRQAAPAIANEGGYNEIKAADLQIGQHFKINL